MIYFGSRYETKRKEALSVPDLLKLNPGLLCYNFELKQYQIVDRSDFEIMETYNEDEMDEALAAIFSAQ